MLASEPRGMKVHQGGEVVATGCREKLVDHVFIQTEESKERREERTGSGQGRKPSKPASSDILL